MSISTIALCVNNDIEWSETKLNNTMKVLPNKLIKKAKTFRFWNDRQAFILGKLLVKRVLEENSKFNLCDIQYNSYGKPYVKGDISFSVSHSGSYVICLFSLTTNSIGVDIEKIDSKINLNDFEGVLTTKESLRIKDSKSPKDTFYETWTIKEAGMKADGRGMNIPLNEIDISCESLKIEEKKWYHYPLDIEENYKCSLVVDSPEFFVCFNKINDEELMNYRFLAN